MEGYLKPAGQAPGIGPERGRRVADGIAKYTSVYPGSTRYVYYIDSKPVAALQIVSRDKKVGLIANVFVVSKYRRKGYAIRLLLRARRDFKVIQHAVETHLSESGRAWRDKVK